jgi:hypothetical protein
MFETARANISGDCSMPMSEFSSMRRFSSASTFSVIFFIADIKNPAVPAQISRTFLK